MAGFPTFQGNAFQPNAFQAGSNLVAGAYALGAPSFDKPTLGENFHLTAAAYALGSPSFAAPPITISQNILHPAPLSLGSPIFAAPFISSFQFLTAKGFAVVGPDFSSPAIITQQQVFFANRFDVEPLAWDKVSYEHNYTFSTVDYVLASPSYAPPNPPATVQIVFGGVDFVLGAPDFAYPRLTATIPAHTYYPPSYFTQVQQATNILNGVLDHLQAAIPNVVNQQTNTVRALIFAMRANADAEIRGTTLGTDLAAIYQAANAAGASYAGLEATRAYIVSQAGGTPNAMTSLVINCALNMTLAAECQAITRMTFSNRDDASTMLANVSAMFEQAKQVASLVDDPSIYEAVIALGGATANYLAQQQIQLPRFMAFDAKAAFPSLYLAQRIYADPTRYAEIEAENGVVNPVFCPAQLRVLSNGGY
jgi:hypothetical protein